MTNKRRPRPSSLLLDALRWVLWRALWVMLLAVAVLLWASGSVHANGSECEDDSHPTPTCFPHQSTTTSTTVPSTTLPATTTTDVLVSIPETTTTVPETTTSTTVQATTTTVPSTSTTVPATVPATTTSTTTVVVPPPPTVPPTTVPVPPTTTPVPPHQMPATGWHVNGWVVNIAAWLLLIGYVVQDWAKLAARKAMRRVQRKSK